MPDFDKYSENYQQKVDRSISFVKKGHGFFTGEKYKLLKRNLVSGDSKILDIGCGIGSIHHFFAEDNISLTGIDVSHQSLHTAREKFPKNRYLEYDGKKIPFSDNTFDFIFAICVLHHISIDGWKDFMLESYRVLGSRGKMIIIEHNPLNPLTRVAVNNCEFDKEAVLLTHFKTQKLFRDSGYKNVCSRHFLFFPFSNPLSDFIANRLSWLPVGAQYLTIGCKDQSS